MMHRALAIRAALRLFRLLRWSSGVYKAIGRVIPMGRPHDQIMRLGYEKLVRLVHAVVAVLDH